MTLEPCPFCGGVKFNICATDYLERRAYAVACLTPECHGAVFSLGFGDFPTEAEAIAAWNTRAMQSASPEGRVSSALRELRDAVGETLDKDFGFWSSPAQSERWSRLYNAWKNAAALSPQEAAPNPAAVTADATERPLLSEEPMNAGADHAPASATRDGSVAPEGQVTEALRDAVIRAYKAGALAVHEAHMEDEQPWGFGSPEFTEAAHDYADAALTTTPAHADEQTPGWFQDEEARRSSEAHADEDAELVEKLRAIAEWADDDVAATLSKAAERIASKGAADGLREALDRQTSLAKSRLKVIDALKDENEQLRLSHKERPATQIGVGNE
jgi:Lar family restriction alleviation protein